MRFRDLHESPDAITLYRGDATEITRFDIEQTDADALFGRGIYLTDNPQVAHDYTLNKGDDGDIAYRSPVIGGLGFRSEKELVRHYLEGLAQELGYDDAYSAVRNKWSKWARDREDKEAPPRPLSSEPYAVRTEKENARAAFLHKNRQAIYDEAEAKRKEELVQLNKSFAQKAKKLYQERIKTMKVVRLSTGEWVFTKPSRRGVVSTFEVPRSYAAKTLDVETPISDDLLPLVKKAFETAYPNREGENRYDLRVWDATGNQRMGLTFDEYIEGFKKFGTRYAWSDGRNIGGTGKNPTLDEILIGTHAGYSVMKNSMDSLISDLKSKGYVGFTYQGGVRMGGNAARGGGEGVMHRAYSFWDDAKINSFRRENWQFSDQTISPKSSHRVKIF